MSFLTLTTTPAAIRFWRGFTLLLILIVMCLQFGDAHAQATYARPYAGGGPNNYPTSLGNTVSAVYLVDPVSGNPLTPAGTVTGGSGSNPVGVSLNGTLGATSATILTAGQVAHWMIIQNTSASNILYVSFNNPATTTNSYVLAAGASLTIPTGTSNGLFAIGSAASTTYAIVTY